MKYIIGRGDNLMDWTYAGNVAQVRCAACFSFFLQERGKAAGSGGGLARGRVGWRTGCNGYSASA